MGLHPSEDVCNIPQNELEIDFHTGTGKGGQNQNRTLSACRIVHKPTGLTVNIQGRDSHKNKRLALTILNQRVKDKRAEELSESRNLNQKSQLKSCSRSDKIRTYNYLQDRVTDHRSGKQTRIKNIEKGKFEELNE